MSLEVLNRRLVIYWDEGHGDTDTVKITTLKEVIEDEDYKLTCKEITNILNLDRGCVLYFDSMPMLFDYGNVYMMRVK